MTVENLIDLFEKGIELGINFVANTKDSAGKFMEFHYRIKEKHPEQLDWKGLGRIGIVCELCPEDYYEGHMRKVPFGLTHYIRYETSIDGVKPFKFPIDHETFSRLLIPFRVKERLEASERAVKTMAEFQTRMGKIEKEFNIEISSSHREVMFEKIKID